MGCGSSIIRETSVALAEWAKTGSVVEVREPPLLPRIMDMYEKAVANGKLIPIQTRTEALDSDSPDLPPFVIMVATAPIRKPTRQQSHVFVATTHPPDPFVNPDPEMTVTSLTGGSHNLIFNKYPVVKYHLLVATAGKLPQAEPLQKSDMLAVRRAMEDAYPKNNCLCFYNCGMKSGCSLGHRHIQLIPLFPETGAAYYFLDSILRRHGPSHINVPYTLDELPFVHAYTGLDTTSDWSTMYSELRQMAGIKLGDPHSWLATSNWMFVAPRTAEGYAGMNVNSLGYMGTLLARSDADVDLIRTTGVLQILKACGIPLENPCNLSC